MTNLSDLKPKKEFLVMTLLADAGFDVSDWANYNGDHPASNPKYCYNWSFEQPGEKFAVCLWFLGLKKKGDDIYHALIPRNRGARRADPGSANWNKRSDEMQDRIRRAYEQQLPIRVIVVDGKQRNPTDVKPVASKVSARLLDPEPWAVKEYNLATGEWLLIRGAKPFAPAVETGDVELSFFEGKSRWRFILHRKREAELRRAKIAEATAAGKLRCEVPNCGFDFEARYGALETGYAQVHHKIPLKSAPPQGGTILLKDLAIVCANCHAMIHRGGECRPLAGLISS
ncbi:MAG: HNH endonuclease [Alphaproteobacteria bacterium]|nr:HNH endonuclease [Alphaproteobacteria bacterium]